MASMLDLEQRTQDPCRVSTEDHVGLTLLQALRPQAFSSSCKGFSQRSRGDSGLLRWDLWRMPDALKQPGYNGAISADQRHKSVTPGNPPLLYQSQS